MNKHIKVTYPFNRSERTAAENEITDIIVNGCRLVGMSGIKSELGAREFYTRAYLCTAVGMRDFWELRYADVLANLGVTLSLTPVARPRFLAMLNGWLSDRARTEVPFAIQSGEALALAVEEGSARL